MKRIFDIVFSLAGIIILSPLLVVIAVAVVLNSSGGAFYRQKRVGKNGQEFLLWKFRTMRTGSDKQGLLTVGSRDSRVTTTGYFLRKYKLDELPQLFNVLSGDMSLVGPRPEVKKYVNLYTEEQRKVLSVRPGITDYASIEFSNENDILAASDEPERMYIEKIMPEKLNLNLKYIQKMGLFTDIQIILRTLLKIVGIK